LSLEKLRFYWTRYDNSMPTPKHGISRVILYCPRDVLYDEGLARKNCIKLYLLGKKSIVSWYFQNPLYTKMLKMPVLGHKGANKYM